MALTYKSAAIKCARGMPIESILIWQITAITIISLLLPTWCSDRDKKMIAEKMMSEGCRLKRRRGGQGWGRGKQWDTVKTLSPRGREEMARWDRSVSLEDGGMTEQRESVCVRGRSACISEPWGSSRLRRGNGPWDSYNVLCCCRHGEHTNTLSEMSTLLDREPSVLQTDEFPWDHLSLSASITLKQWAEPTGTYSIVCYILRQLLKKCSFLKYDLK